MYVQELKTYESSSRLYPFNIERKAESKQGLVGVVGWEGGSGVGWGGGLLLTQQAGY